MDCLILGKEDDEHGRHVLNRLTKLGAEACIFDTSLFPWDARISISYQNNRVRLVLPSKTAFFLDELKSIYWRNYRGINIPRQLLTNPDQSFIATNDSRSFMESLLGWPGMKWVNGWQGFRLHQTKPLALKMVADIGIKIPETLSTNDPDMVSEFFQSHASVIFKPIQGGAHTMRLSERFLSQEHLNNLRLSPVTLQEEIPGTNVRIFVIGERVFGLEVKTDEIDFRDDREAKILPYLLTPEMEQKARHIATTLKLSWSGMDFRVHDKTGEFYFLEANPSPMFIGFEQLSGVPITQYFCDYLLEK